MSKNLNDLLRAGGYIGGNAGDVVTDDVFSPNLMEASKPVLKRVRALKQYQLESIEVETKFYERVHQLEMEFQPLFEKINAKRKAVVAGEYEPTDDECKLPVYHGRSDEELQKLEDEAVVEGTPSKGVPGFWYHCLNNTAQIADTIREYDVPVLKHLIDITSEMKESPASYTLKFHFESNPYFKNTVLSKYYEMNLKPEADDPFSYDGPTIVKSRGDQIEWFENKSVTSKVVKKKAKKGPQAGQYVTKVVTNESFFNFFDPTEKVLDETTDNEDELHNDFEIGQIIRDQIIPRAVLFYTGEVADSDDEFFEGEEEDEDVDEVDSDA